MAFNFGAPAAAPAPAGGGFSFGAPAPAPGGTAAAPAAGGFGFGAPAPAPTAAATAPAPAGGGFGFGASASTAAGAPPAGALAPSSTLSQPTMLPVFEETFPFLQIHARITSLLSRLEDDNTDSLEGQELVELLAASDQIGSLLAKPIVLKPRAVADASKRQALQQQPSFITIPQKQNSGTQQQQKDPTLVPPAVWTEIFALADALGLPELEAACLYAGASDESTRSWLSQQLPPPTVERNANDVAGAAMELYLLERSKCLATIFTLIQARLPVASQYEAMLSESSTSSLPEKNPILLATDQLIQAGLIPNLIQLIKDLTTMCDTLRTGINEAYKQQKVSAATAAASAAQSNVTSSYGGMFTQQQQQPQQPAPPAPLGQQGTISNEALYIFLCGQRQVASECLFYLAYHVQMEAMEVASLVDLIRDLTNPAGALPAISPQDLVISTPSIFQSQNHKQQGDHSIHNLMHNTMSSQFRPPTMPEKEPMEWQEEFVSQLWQEGKPQLLRTVSVLITAVVCALDGHHVLLDRKRHTANSFGVGNALLPPLGDDEQQPQLEQIHARFDPAGEPHKAWQRPDIWGLLSAAYALLLRPAATSSGGLSSPLRSPGSTSTTSPLRMGGSTLVVGSGSIDAKATFRACLAVAAETKSLTFARTSLIPSFAKHTVSGNGDTSSFGFYMSVLSDFTAQYLDALCVAGELSVSRAQWQSDEDQELQLRHVQEQQRRQFASWSGDTTAANATVDLPTEIDVSKRPDCSDDIIALAVALCSECPKCAHHFWSTQEMATADDDYVVSVQFVPSRALKKLERLQADDPSLLPAYLSLLAALALADSPDANNPALNGAAAVHSLLSSLGTSTSSDSDAMTWYYLLSAVRWFADELSPPDNDSSGGSSSSASMRSSAEGLRRSTSGGGYDTTGSQSTAYYYGADYNGTEGTNGGYLSQSQHQGSGSKNSGSASSSRNRPSERKELGEANTLNLVAILGLISHVAAKSSVARGEILSIKVAAPGSNDVTSSMVLGGIEDDPLTILFSLLTVPIPPNVRGLTFVAIANLIRCKTTNESANIGRRGWDLLEACRILPIGLLSQYPPLLEDRSLSSTRNSGPFGSNVRKSSSGQYAASAWFPASAEYGIVYELEHVEAQSGSYPATEGLLYLLSTLVSTSGCPSDLGSQWRAQSGCAPYIEFVTDFVLPRAMGLKKTDSGLSFASPADKCRLISRSLEVLDAILSRYVVPPPGATEQTIPSRDLQSKPSNGTLALSIVTTQNTKSSHPPSLAEEIMVNLRTTIQSASEETGLGPILNEIFVISTMNEMEEAVRDYRDELVDPYPSDKGFNLASETFQMAMSVPVTATPTAISAPMGHRSSTSDRGVPRAKSPGFSILSDILSSNGGSLFRMITEIVTENQNSKGIAAEYGEKSYEQLLAQAIFGEIAPIFENVKTATGYKFQEKNSTVSDPSMNSALFQSMSRPLFPPVLHPIGQDSCARELAVAHDAIFWREQSVAIAFRLLCAAAGREKSFYRALQSSNIEINIVPVLRFRAPVHGSYASKELEVRPVRISRLSEQLTVASGMSSVEVIPAVAQYVGYSPFALDDEEEIARGAMSIVSYLCNILARAESADALSGRVSNGRRYLAEAMSRRLLMTSGNTLARRDIRVMILDLILTNLTDSASVEEANLSHILLGVADIDIDAYRKQSMRRSKESVSSASSGSQNCFEAILSLLGGASFVLDPKTSGLAAKCYEIIFRLCNSRQENHSPASLARKAIIMSNLRRNNFWEQHLLRFLGCNSSDAASSTILATIVARTSMEAAFDGNTVDDFHADNILHSIAWLLKGVAAELFMLMGFDHEQSNIQSNFVGISELLAPQPSRSRRLLSLLFQAPHMLLQNTLIDLPLSYPMEAVAQFLDSYSPSREVIKAASVPLPGPQDVFGGYTIASTDRLLYLLRRRGGSSDLGDIGTGTLEPKTDEERAALSWAHTWNTSVLFTCASSHLADAWGRALATSVVCCRDILLNVEDHRMIVPDSMDGAMVSLDVDGVTEFLIGLLFRLSIIDTNSDNIPSAYDKFNAGSLLALSIATLHLVELLVDMKMVSPSASNAIPTHDESSRGNENVTKICMLLAKAIASCAVGDGSGGSQNDERAAVLSCALTAVLDAGGDCENSMVFSSASVDERQPLVEAAVHLSRLSSMEDSGTIIGEGKLESKNTYIVLAARAGLASLISLFDAPQEGGEVSRGDSFLVRVFTPTPNGYDSLKRKPGRLSRLVRLVASLDNNICVLLERIACCKYGAELLQDAGVLSVLISAGEEYSKEEATLTNQGHRGDSAATYGSYQINPPSYLSGHLSLLNTMLAAKSMSEASRNSIGSDAASVLKYYASTGERLLGSYPKDADLTTKFVTCMYLTASALVPPNTTSKLSSSTPKPTSIESLVGDGIWLRLERQVMGLAYHLAEYPFPVQMLPPLPHRLQDLDRSRMSKVNLVSVSAQPGRIWWDFVNDNLEGTTSMAQGFLLSDPPTGPANSNTSSRFSYGNPGTQYNEQTWSTEKYKYAISAGKCLDACLLSLKKQMMSSKEDGNVTILDAAAIGKGLCRCSDAARAIEERINSIQLPTDGALANALEDTMLMDDSDRSLPTPTELKQVERNALLVLGPILAGVVEKMLVLAGLQVRSLTQDFVRNGENLTSSNLNRKAIDEFTNALLPALQHTQLESTGIGCLYLGETDGERNEKKLFGSAIARRIREDLEHYAR